MVISRCIIVFSQQGAIHPFFKNDVAINSQTTEIDFFSRSFIRMFCIKIEEKDIQVGSHPGNDQRI
jgi:hypothetical protein